MPRSCIKISDTVVLGIPGSASSSRTVSSWFLLIAALIRSTFSGVLLVAGLPKHGSLLTDSQSPLKCFCHSFICAALIALSRKAFWVIQIVSTEECSSLMQNLMQICCSNCSVISNTTGHTVHMLTQRHLLPSLTSAVKLSLFTYVHSSPLPWLLNYIDVVQTILMILKMAGLFPDRPWYYINITDIKKTNNCVPRQSYVLINNINIVFSRKNNLEALLGSFQDHSSLRFSRVPVEWKASLHRVPQMGETFQGAGVTALGRKSMTSFLE